MRADACEILKFARQEDFVWLRPALISAYNGRPGRQVWLFPFKVCDDGR